MLFFDIHCELRGLQKKDSMKKLKYSRTRKISLHWNEEIIELPVMKVFFTAHYFTWKCFYFLDDVCMCIIFLISWCMCCPLWISITKLCVEIIRRTIYSFVVIKLLEYGYNARENLCFHSVLFNWFTFHKTFWYFIFKYFFT